MFVRVRVWIRVGGEGRRGESSDAADGCAGVTSN